MTSAELIAALQEECRADRLRVEDFVRAVSDLCAETLKTGQPFHFGDIGFFAVNPRLSRTGKGVRAAITFQASKSFRRRIGAPDESVFVRKAPGTCKTCGIRPGKVRVFDECDPCMHARGRARKRT